MARKTVRIVRFVDQGAFRRSVDFLCELYPQADRASFETALARLPARLSHDADEAVAMALADALDALGARVLVQDLSTAGPGKGAGVASTQDVGAVIDAAFLKGARKSTASLGSARALPSHASATAPPQGKARAPWEP